MVHSAVRTGVGTHGLLGGNDVFAGSICGDETVGRVISVSCLQCRQRKNYWRRRHMMATVLFVCSSLCVLSGLVELYVVLIPHTIVVTHVQASGSRGDRTNATDHRGILSKD